ncbi:MAG: hypothetical protein NUK65_11590 [Firmicutes bacterium]|nr:hypothetical protein [Bacillota bacterium]
MKTDDVMVMADEYWQEKKIHLQLWLESPMGRLASPHIREAVREKIMYCDERISAINHIISEEEQATFAFV